jgi:hypothetical protein
MLASVMCTSNIIQFPSDDDVEETSSDHLSLSHEADTATLYQSNKIGIFALFLLQMLAAPLNELYPLLQMFEPLQLWFKEGFSSLAFGALSFFNSN